MPATPDRAAPVGMAPDFADGIYRLERCNLVVADRHWAFERDHADAIGRHFRAVGHATPEFYNGRVFVMGEGRLADGALDGVLTPTDFASYHFWRAEGFDVRCGRDVFGKAIIEAGCGGLLLGRAAPYTMNAGRADLIGGFIDPIDVDFDGTVDIDASIVREIVEETGLDLALFERAPGYILTVEGALVSIGVHYRSQLPAVDLVGRIDETLRGQGKPEVTGMVVVEPHQRADRAALEALGVPPYVARLFGALAGDAA